jgi:opacity protein-like surface antigen
MRAASIVVATLAMLSLAPAAHAQVGPRQFVGLYGGATLPTGDLADVVDGNYGFQIGVFRFVESAHWFAAGLELGYLDFEGEQDIDFTITPVSLQGRAYALKPDAPLRPYATLGLGAYYVRAETGLLAKTEYDFAMMAGGGAEWAVHPKIKLAADAQFHWVTRDDLDPTFAVLRLGVVLPIGG